MVQVLESINRLVWGVPTLALILGVGIYISVRTGFCQLRLFPRALKDFLSQFRRKNCAEGAVSPFEALCTALAATVGTGNLAGVAGALTIGGPGAIFWMWVCALLGMALKFAEATLAIRFRCRDENGELVGGPMYMIQRGMGSRFGWLAAVYCFFGVVAAFGVGNATQINAVVSGVNAALASFGIPEDPKINLLLGIVLSVVIAGLLLGGMKRIGKAAQLLVPFAAAAYLLLGLFVLLLRLDHIPHALESIISGAFSPRAVTGGVVGSMLTALRIGVSRGIFTNEAGMGTAAIAHAAADVPHPAKQGLMGIMEVFLDTIVICTVTALVILVSGVPLPYGVDEGAALTARAFSAVCGDWAGVFLAMALCCFALATVLGWGLYGIRCAQYLFGAKVWRKFVVLQALTVVLGAVLKTGTVWLLSETVNGLMAIPNLIALAALSPELIRLTKEFTNKAESSANGGTYESFHQCQSLRAVSYAEIPSSGSKGAKGRKNHLPSKHRPA